MIRFLAFGLFIVTAMVALFAMGADLLGFVPARGALLSPGLLASGAVSWRLAFGSWLLEALGLAALFLAVERRDGARWMDGLVTGALAWVFRGPLLVITIVVATGAPHAPWWRLVVGWLLLYLACGLVLAALARSRRSEAAEQPPEHVSSGFAD